MAKEKFSELKNLNAADLKNKKNALSKELFELRQKKVTGQLEKPHHFKAARKKIAQINTILRENENVRK